jgi:hypothetical protein
MSVDYSLLSFKFTNLLISCLHALAIATPSIRKSTMDPYGRILDFLDWSRYFVFQAAPQLYSQG